MSRIIHGKAWAEIYVELLIGPWMGKRIPSFGSAFQGFWGDVIFYNFVQHLVGDGPRQRPHRGMWESDPTVSGFKEVLEVHAPDRVLVLGKTAWQMLPGNECFTAPNLPRKELRFRIPGESFRRGLDVSDQIAYWYPTTPGSYALCAPVFHPAYPAGFYRPETRETVKLLMKNSWKPSQLSIVTNSVQCDD